jgi:DegV family protein with EDD domain
VKGDTILSIHISGKLSGTLATVESAARELAGEFQIFVFDSAAGSMAQGFMAREARLMARAGAAMPEILRRLEFIRRHWTVIFTLDTLEYAYLSGRISALQSIFASALQVKPIIVLRDGLLEMAERVRTRSRALDRVLQSVKDRLGSQLVNLAVVHAADPACAQTMLERANSLLNIKECFLADLSIPVAANLGPGAIGIIAYPLEGE